MLAESSSDELKEAGRRLPARVAVVAVHGVSDPRPNESNASIADLLTSIDDHGPAYDAFVREDLQIPVRGLPVPDRSRHQRCDYCEYVSSSPPESGGRVHDPGLAFTASLLACYEPDEPDGIYHTTVLHGSRLAHSSNSTACHVDVFEMYWADLSRVTGGLTRIFAEFFQLLFHIESVGGHAVLAGMAAETTARDAKHWRRWASAQRSAALLLTREVILFNLFLAGLLFAALGGLFQERPAGLITAGFVTVGTVAAVTLVSYRHRRGAPFAAVASLVVALVTWFALRSAPWSGRRALTTVLLVVASTVIFWIAERYERYRPGVARRAIAYGSPLLAIVLFELWTGAAVPDDRVVPSTILHGIEVAHAALFVFWIAFLLRSWLAFWFGRVIARQAVGEAATRRDALNLTARFTLAGPALFFLLTMVAVWAGLWVGLHGIGDQPDRPASSIWLQPHTPLVTTRWLSLDVDDAQTVERVAEALLSSGAGPALGTMVILLTIGLVLVLLALAPSVISEFRPPKHPADGTTQGIWLTSGFRLVKLAGRLAIASVLVVLPAGFVAARLVPPRVLESLSPVQNEQVLFWFGSGLTAFIAAMVMFGDRLRVLTLGLRNGLDAILDVDNYLREHPRTATPRARVFTRMGSLLRHVYARNYDVVVIIAESQGAVIAAELLRFVRMADLAKFDSTLMPPQDTRLALFTMGAPLRQAYGLRFPHLYRWARHELTEPWKDPSSSIGEKTAPDPSELGASLWVNAYRSGDYVGRNLWRPDGSSFNFETPKMSAALPWRAGPFPVVASESAPPPVNRREFCIGPGGHTHYRDSTAPQIALELDRLISCL